MKKTLLFIISSLVTAQVFAAPISREDALEAAGRFFGGNTKSVAKALKIVKTGFATKVQTPLEFSQEPTYYVVNRNGGGFVILAADDSVQPLIAWSFEGNIPENEELNPNMKWWLDDVVGNEIAYARAVGTGKFEIEKMPLKAGTPVVLYKTASWDQDAPFNGESPTISGKKTITGCGATAMAIKCRYHEWPYKGSGKTPAYTYQGGQGTVKIPENTLGRIYDYSNMPIEVYDGKWTSAQKAAVAALMYDMGTGCEMMFGPSSTGGSATYSTNMAYAMRTYFHYNSRAKVVDKSGTEQDWAERLEAELDANGPILYGGQDANGGGGHAFVFDGYTDDHYFHVNWGWSGSSNCYVTTKSVVPAGSGNNFKVYQDAILDCGPDKSGVYTPDEVAEMTSIKYQDKKLTISNKEKYDVVISKDEETVKTFNGNAAGSSITIALSELKGNGNYTILIRLTDWYVQFPDAQYTLEFEF